MCENDELQQQQQKQTRNRNYKQPTPLKPIAPSGPTNNGHNVKIETSSLSTSVQQQQPPQDYLPDRCMGSEQSNRACHSSQSSSEISNRKLQRNSAEGEHTLAAASAPGGQGNQQQIISDIEVEPKGSGVVTEQVMLTKDNLKDTQN